jgi:hypothetical protein
MIIRNNWNHPRRQWDKLAIKLRISSLDIFSVEIDASRNFYCLTILNISFKNR